MSNKYKKWFNIKRRVNNIKAIEHASAQHMSLIRNKES